MARKPLDQDLYDSVVEEAKRKFAVWPSAYASGWVVKTYKERGGRYAGAGRKERTGLTKWFGENWVDLSRPTADGGYEPCGRKRSDDPADYPKCRPEREAMRMSKEEVADAVRRKRRAEASAPGRGSRARAPKRVATYEENPRAQVKTLESLGLPTTWWHGTTQDFERLSFSKNVLGVVWLADFESAKAYADKHYAKADRKWLVEVELSPDTRVLDLTEPEEPFIDELVALLNQAAEARGFSPTRTREEWLANRYQYGDLETYPFVVALLKKRGVGALIMNDVQGWGGHAPTKSLALLSKKNIVDQTRRRLSDFETRVNPEGIDGDALAAWCDSNESYAVLDATASAGSSWMAGACVLLAKALVSQHPGARLVGIEVDGVVQHVGALVGDVVYDALGAHDERAWAADWLDYEQLDPRTPAHVVSLEGVPASALPDVESPATARDVRLVASALSGARTNPRTGAYRNPRKPPPLTERELEDLPRANAFWMDFEVENGPEHLPAAMQDAQWPADRDDVELARVVLAFFYRTAPGNY